MNEGNSIDQRKDLRTKVNAPPAFESFLLFEGEKKIIIEKETKVPNAAIFTVNNKNHTLGNLIRCQLLKDPNVIFAGYKVPHPLEHKFILRVQTVGDYTPQDALKNALSDLNAEISYIEERFKKKIKPTNETDQQVLTMPLVTMEKSVYLPPAKWKKLQDASDKQNLNFQKLSWEALKKSINGLVNKTNASNLPVIVRELLKENLIRGQGVLCQSIITAQSFGPIFSNVYAALVAVINSKLPQIGKLIVTRVINNFCKSYLRSEKSLCINSARFLAHLVNQQVVGDILALEILFMLLENATNDSIEVAVCFLKECGAKLQSTSPKGLITIFDALRNNLNERNLNTRVQYAVEVLIAIRKDGFKDHPIIIPELDLLEEGDKITHQFELDGQYETKDELNVFHFDPEYLENEEKYKILKKEVLDDSESEDDDGDEDEDEKEIDSNEERSKITDESSIDLVALRRKIYLILQSSLQPEEAAHKLMKLGLTGGDRTEMCFTIIDCCAQQRTFIQFYGLIAQNFSSISHEYSNIFSSVFVDCFSKIHRFLDSIKLRNIAGFFSHLLITGSIPWTVLSCVKINEDDTTSASRVFIKYLFQEISDFLGVEKVKEEFEIQPCKKLSLVFSLVIIQETLDSR
ncbi:pre-mRNA-splicing factor CWC22 homolog [Panonychus citri]|uniref:pre-mRNA-splicing factor CWC22 homolog n=1 Tax=Panonychus citri TaxID=50023 RepID=UPI00230800F2|nr:pre-mRNA-splicing factor CWC22 homolog [Panonychus citri]